jgi:CheY-like chemotaxis protein
MLVIERDEVYEALRALGDNVALAGTALASRLPEVAAATTLEQRAARLRSLLLQAIELLRPPRRSSFGSLESRSYDVLTLRYVEGLSVREVCQELSLGPRQVHRALREAEAKLARVISGQVAGSELAAGTVGGDPLAGELLTLDAQPMTVQLVPVLREALSLVQPLAERLGVTLQIEPLPESAPCLGDPAILKQLLVQFTSAALQASAPGGAVSLALHAEREGPLLQLRFEAEPQRLHAERFAAAERIALSLGIQCRAELRACGRSEVRLRLRAGGPLRVLVVEDNPGVAELYKRYLAPMGWVVHVVADPRLAAEVARRNQPDAIVLDVMMPKSDGWTVLAQLRAQPETTSTPVVVCSVVDDPELALTLGASAYLRKPVSRSQLIAALRRSLAAGAEQRQAPGQHRGA